MANHSVKNDQYITAENREIRTTSGIGTNPGVFSSNLSSQHQETSHTHLSNPRHAHDGNLQNRDPDSTPFTFSFAERENLDKLELSSEVFKKRKLESVEDVATYRTSQTSASSASIISNNNSTHHSASDAIFTYWPVPGEINDGSSTVPIDIDRAIATMVQLQARKSNPNSVATPSMYADTSVESQFNRYVRFNSTAVSRNSLNVDDQHQAVSAMEPSINDADTSKVELFNIEIDASNNEQVTTFLLQPFDVINIRKVAVYEKPEVVTVSGAVPYTGSYVLSNKKEKVFDVIKRAGGLTSEADTKGVKIKRPIQASQIEALVDVNLNLEKNDSSETKLTKKLKEEIKYAVIPIEWDKIIEDPQDYSNITLLPGDAIEVAIRNENVKVTGNVLLTSEIPFIRRKGLNYYIDAVGGIDNKGWKKKAYIIYPNGKAAVTNNFLFFKFFPKVIAGSQIVIPEKPESNKITVGEIMSIASVLVGMAAVVIALFR